MMEKKKGTNTKSMIAVFVLFDLLTTAIYFYLTSLDKDIHGNYLMYDLGIVFRQQVVTAIGAVAVVGWGMFCFYLLQIFFSKRTGKDRRPFKL
ncbi:MAG: hypothetical protein II927_03485 [Paludibacteraceae bacterium]|jgi:hypothetical protein|nr:hypothetical protein [Paludibacteraceae bacterium]